MIFGTQLHNHIYGDDAAITFRYVERVVAGHGLTYNDHERVAGNSNPLYTLVLAALHFTGIGIEDATGIIAMFGYVATALLTIFLCYKLSGLIGGLLSGMFITVAVFFRAQAFSGMESILSAVLGLLVVVFIYKNKNIIAGVCLGLAIWNKLDAGILAIAVFLAWILVYKNIPWKIIFSSLGSLLPWLLFSYFYYDSPIPNSFLTKAALHSNWIHFDHFWILKFIENNFLYASLLLLSLLLFFYYIKMDKASRLATIILLFWFLLHSLVFSALNLGDYYPWYLTVLLPPIVILGSAFISNATSKIFSNKIVALIIAVTVFGFISYESVLATIEELKNGNRLKNWEVFDNDRRMAGIFLSQFSDSSEVVESAYGWIAYEVENVFNDKAMLNSKELKQPVSYLVESGIAPVFEGCRPPAQPHGYIPLAVFNLASDMFPGYTWFTVFGLPNSHIAQSGKRFLQLRLFELEVPLPYSADLGLKNFLLNGTDAFVHPPCGATFGIHNNRQTVHLVFTPGFNSNTPIEKSDGVTFNVLIEDKSVYTTILLPGVLEKTVIIKVPQSDKMDSLQISFITLPGPNLNIDYDWAIYKNVKIIIGDAFVDINRIYDPDLREALGLFNPTFEVKDDK